MKTGNPKAVGALIGAVLIAIVFDGASYLTHQRRPVSVAVPETKAAPNIAAPELPLPTKVTNNPFFHPALLLKATSSGSNTFVPPSAPHHFAQNLEPIGTLPVPWTGKALPSAAIGLAVAPTKSDPVMKTHTFQIGATVDSTSPVALISIDGGSSKSYRPGDSLIDGIRVGHISEGSVAIDFSGKTFTLRVGEKLQK